MTWGLCLEYPVIEQFRRAWSYLHQENEVPNTWERDTPEGMDYKWKGWHCVQDLSTVPDPLIVLTAIDGSKLKGKTSLYEFVHPENAVYYFGSDKRDLHHYHLEGRDYQTVYIPDGGFMFSFEAAAMVIYDRRFKQWQSQTAEPS